MDSNPPPITTSLHQPAAKGVQFGLEEVQIPWTNFRATAFDRELEKESSLDLAYGNTRLADRPDLILRTVLEMARSASQEVGKSAESGIETAETLEQRLLSAVGPERREEALETLQIGRLSWRLRDNDNLLLARVESQLLRAIDAAARRLASAGRLAPRVNVLKDADLVTVDGYLGIVTIGPPEFDLELAETT